MEQKQLGSSTAHVPAIGFGTWRYSGGVKPLRAVVERGFCFVDTAETYGTEELVGEAIRGRRERVFLASKAAPRNFRRPDLIRAAENSLRRLGTDYLDLYQLHWPNLRVPIEETMAAMEQLADSGKIRFLGLSNFSLGQLLKAQRALTKHKIVTNQVRYSLVDRSIESGLLRYCQQNQVTIIAYSPLGLDFSSLKRADPHGVLGEVARSAGKTEAQVALNWLISKEHVVAIPKASTVAHALEDWEATGWRLPADSYKLLEEKIVCRRDGWMHSVLLSAYRYARQSVGRSL